MVCLIVSSCLVSIVETQGSSHQRIVDLLINCSNPLTATVAQLHILNALRRDAHQYFLEVIRQRLMAVGIRYVGG